MEKAEKPLKDWKWFLANTRETVNLFLKETETDDASLMQIIALCRRYDIEMIF